MRLDLGREVPEALEERKGAVEEAVRWTEQHPEAWEWMVEQAVSARGRASMRWIMEGMRRRFRVRVKNGHAPIFTRLIRLDHPDVPFCLARSQYDRLFEILGAGR
ncbi:hypothetical protein GMI70_02970 [Eggerthellaceae bacterium zg-893]|nr:hypothetical protein [Eggerthellaceae bacterium zg-893]